MANSSLDNVNELLRLIHGDKGRLEDIKRRLENGQALYISDNNYLQQLVNQYRGEIQKIIESTTPEPTPEPEPTQKTNSFGDDDTVKQNKDTKKKEEKQSSLCGKCGKMVNDDVKFCPFCGKKTKSNKSKKQGDQNKIKRSDVAGADSVMVKLVACIVIALGGILLASTVNMAQFYAGQYVMLGLFVIIIGGLLFYASGRMKKKITSHYICGYCKYIAETERELFNHSIVCEKKIAEES